MTVTPRVGVITEACAGVTSPVRWPGHCLLSGRQSDLVQ